MRDVPKHRRSQVTAAIITTGVVVSAFVALGGPTLGFSAVGQAQKQYGGKIAVCHRGHHTIKVSAKAWPAHKRHGDTLGVCARKKGKPVSTGQSSKQNQGGAHSENAKGKQNRGGAQSENGKGSKGKGQSKHD